VVQAHAVCSGTDIVVSISPATVNRPGLSATTLLPRAINVSTAPRAVALFPSMASFGSAENGSRLGLRLEPSSWLHLCNTTERKHHKGDTAAPRARKKERGAWRGWKGGGGEDEPIQCGHIAAHATNP